jgi:hypothetical protein
VSGNLYFADTGNNRVRRISSDGIITTIAGNGTAGYAGDGGPATQAALKVPNDVAVGPGGEIFIADTFNFVIRKVATDGTISTFAGKPGQFGYNGDGAKPTDSLLNRPYGIEFNAAGDLFIADTHNHRIRVIRK